MDQLWILCFDGDGIGSKITAATDIPFATSALALIAKFAANLGVAELPQISLKAKPTTRNAN